MNRKLADPTGQCSGSFGHFDAYPDPPGHFDAYPACHLDADLDPTFYSDADPNPSFQIKAQNLKKCSNRLMFRTFCHVIWKLMRIRIQLVTLMRIRILPFNLMATDPTLCLQGAYIFIKRV